MQGGIHKVCVPISYISETAQNCEKTRNTCLIISRDYSFKGVTGVVSQAGASEGL